METNFVKKNPITWSSKGDTKHLGSYKRLMDGKPQFTDRLKVYYEDCDENGALIYREDDGYIEKINTCQVELDEERCIDPIDVQLGRRDGLKNERRQLVQGDGLKNERTIRKVLKGDTQTKIVSYTMLCNGILHEVPYENVISFPGGQPRTFLEHTRGTIMRCSGESIISKVLVRIKTPVYHVGVLGYDVELVVRTDVHTPYHGYFYKEMFNRRKNLDDKDRCDELPSSFFVEAEALHPIDPAKIDENIKKYVMEINKSNITKVLKIIPKKMEGLDSYYGFCGPKPSLFFGAAGKVSSIFDDWTDPKVGEYIHILAIGDNKKGPYAKKWTKVTKDRGLLKDAYLNGLDEGYLEKMKDCKDLFLYLKRDKDGVSIVENLLMLGSEGLKFIS
jgi:hypothetical protein